MSVNAACNNALFSCDILRSMHEQMIRLYQAAKELRGIDTPSDLAKLLNQSPQTINNWEKRGISRDGLLDAPGIIGCRAEWLRKGAGPMEGDDSVSELSIAQERAPLPQKLLPSEVNIPQFDTGGMGGTGLILQDQPGIIENWQVSQEWAKANIPNCTSFNNLCIVTGFGDSMPEAFNPGDPVIVDLGIRSCTHDGIYFFRVGNEGFIKILQRIPGVGIMAISQNKNYQSWPIREDMDFEVFGKVLKAWKGRNY